MAEDAALTEIEAKVNAAFAEERAMEPHETMHMYFVVSEALVQLGADEVTRALVAEFPWFRGGWDIDSDHWGDGEGALLLLNLAAFIKRGADLLAAWLTAHGLNKVTLTCYLPCHKGYAQASFGSPRG